MDVADRLGDPTARMLGRVSLNPIVHADLIGTVVFPVLALVSGLPLIGWAKPVPVMVVAAPQSSARLRARGRRRAGEQPRAGRDRRAADARATVSPVTIGEPNVTAPLATILSAALRINVLLAVFNMIPIPPLDGGNVLGGLLPAPAARMVQPAAPVRLHAALRAHVHRGPRLPRAAAVRFDWSWLAAVSKARVVSGMRPTGQLHLGHLVGALGNWVPLQAEYDCFYFVADWHALTSDYANTGPLVGFAYENVADWIGAGLDPERSTFFVQSLVPEHAELYLLLSMVVPVPWLERVPTYKEQQENLSDKRPVVDRLPRAIRSCRRRTSRSTTRSSCRWARIRSRTSSWRARSVRRFNNFFGDVLVEPQPLLTKFGRLPGLDGGKKMSKSIGNTIHLSDDAAAVKKKVMQMYTDPKRVRADIPGTVEGNPVFMYHDAFNPDTAEVDDLKARYRAGEVGDVEVKTKLANALNALSRPDPRATGRGARAPGLPSRGAVRRVEEGARRRTGHNGPRP